MTTILAVCEQRGGTIKRVALETVTAARTLADAMGAEVHALVIGPAGIATEALAAHGADKVLVASGDDFDLYQPGAWTSIAVQAAAGCRAVLVAATAMGRDLGPRIAARLEVPLAADVTALDVDADVIHVTRPVYAGKAHARLAVTADRVVVTLRPNNFTPRERAKAGAVSAMALPAITSHGERTVEVKASARATMDVAEAPVVVSGGRGLKEPAQFALLEALAEAFGGEAAVGASRAVVDAGWRPHSEQVGQTGKTVSPKLYIAVGISGAIQHLAGMRTARTIVAINKDKDAPIFKVADYGIVGDLFEIVPRLTEAVRQARSA
jgi:electron transfer flavoprotein alpha subunit